MRSSSKLPQRLEEMIGRRWVLGETDCYQVARIALEEFGLRAFAEDRPYSEEEIWTSSAADAVKAGTSPCDPDMPLLGDILIFRAAGRRPCHIGIYVGDDKFIHSIISIGVCLSTLSMWRRSVVYAGRTGLT